MNVQATLNRVNPVKNFIMQGHETRSAFFKVSVDLTRTRYLFLETAEGLIEKKLNTSFVYADNWSLGIKFKNGLFKCFSSLNELHSLCEIYEVSVIEIFEFKSVLVYDIVVAVHFKIFFCFMNVGILFVLFALWKCPNFVWSIFECSKI